MGWVSALRHFVFIALQYGSRNLLLGDLDSTRSPLAAVTWCGQAVEEKHYQEAELGAFMAFLFFLILGAHTSCRLLFTVSISPHYQTSTMCGNGLAGWLGSHVRYPRGYADADPTWHHCALVHTSHCDDGVAVTCITTGPVMFLCTRICHELRSGTLS